MRILIELWDGGRDELVSFRCHLTGIKIAREGAKKPREQVAIVRVLKCQLVSRPRS